jgi:hypothetical protein
MGGGYVLMIDGYMPKQDVADMLLDIRNGVSAIIGDCDYTVEVTKDLIDAKLKELGGV